MGRYRWAAAALLMLGSISLFAGGPYSLTVTVKDLRNNKGDVQFALYNKKGTIPDKNYTKYYKKAVASIKNGSASVTFRDLPEGRYAVNILHDENQDGKIAKGLMLPTEGIGFSNYNSIGIGNKPNFEKASFELNKNTAKSVKVIYF
jgi:uncharacterized protein (DUF2141 family)